MEVLFGIIAVLFISAGIVDRYLKTETVSSVRAELYGISRRILSGRSDVVVFSAHLLFCRIFDVVYGSEFWSRVRFFRSCCFSLLFILFSVLVIGTSNTILGIQTGSPELQLGLNVLLSYFLAFVMVNFVADFISLQETRWILGLARGRSLGRLAILVLVDLVLTTAIYLVVLGIPSVIAYHFVTSQFSWMYFSWPDAVSTVPSLLFSPKGFLPFFLSTFGTSIVLFGFVLAAIAVRLLTYPRVSNLAMLYIARDARPARTAAGILSVIFVAVFLLGRGILWLIEA